jgi:DNA-binding response OmpR family regulator
MMPEMDGLTLAKEIRLLKPEVPIIFLTAKNQKEDIIEGFRSGADDYITKPFSMEELLYRIEAILRRTTNAVTSRKEESYTIGGYTFEPLKQILSFKGQPLKLTTKESELLELLCRQSNEILERNFALKTIWIDDNYFNARSMDVYITRLRKYLRKDPSVKILNIHGRGYKLIS